MNRRSFTKYALAASIAATIGIPIITSKPKRMPLVSQYMDVRYDVADAFPNYDYIIKFWESIPSTFNRQDPPDTIICTNEKDENDIALFNKGQLMESPAQFELIFPRCERNVEFFGRISPIDPKDLASINIILKLRYDVTAA